MPAIKTDLVDRYLYAVKFWLPKAQQEDILAELREDLLSHMEEREAALGHALDDDEIAEILKRRGDPTKVASSYLPERRLINPAILPVYWLVLKIVLLWVLAPLFALVFLGPMLAAAHPWKTMLLCYVEYLRSAFMTVGMVTVAFVLLDRYQVRFQHAGKWDPRKLPRVPGSQDTGARWKHLTAFVFSIVAAILWAYLMVAGRRVSLSQRNPAEAGSALGAVLLADSRSARGGRVLRSAELSTPRLGARPLARAYRHRHLLTRHSGGAAQGRRRRRRGGKSASRRIGQDHRVVQLHDRERGARAGLRRDHQPHQAKHATSCAAHTQPQRRSRARCNTSIQIQCGRVDQSSSFASSPAFPNPTNGVA